jgi:hypothetical protein
MASVDDDADHAGIPASPTRKSAIVAQELPCEPQRVEPPRMAGEGLGGGHWVLPFDGGESVLVMRLG